MVYMFILIQKIKTATTVLINLVQPLQTDRFRTTPNVKLQPQTFKTIGCKMLTQQVKFMFKSKAIVS